MKYITGPVDPTRMNPPPHGSLGVWRVGSTQVNRLFLISRVGSGRVRRFSNITGRAGSRVGSRLYKSRGSGWVGLRCLDIFAGQLTRSVRFALARQEPWFFYFGFCNYLFLRISSLPPCVPFLFFSVFFIYYFFFTIYYYFVLAPCYTLCRLIPGRIYSCPGLCVSRFRIERCSARSPLLYLR